MLRYFFDFTELLIFINPYHVEKIVTPDIRYWKIIKDLTRKQFFNYILKKINSTAEMAHGFNIYKDVKIECKRCRRKKHFRDEIKVYNFVERHRRCL